MPSFYQTSLVGTEELSKQFRRLGKRWLEVAGGSLYRSGERIMTKSKEVYVPVDTGALRSSGEVLPPEIHNDEVEVILSYGNASVEYAVFVHETNKAYNNGKQWKFLETPLKEGLADAQRDLMHDLNTAEAP